MLRKRMRVSSSSGMKRGEKEKNEEDSEKNVKVVKMDEITGSSKQPRLSAGPRGEGLL